MQPTTPQLDAQIITVGPPKDKPEGFRSIEAVVLQHPAHPTGRWRDNAGEIHEGGNTLCYAYRPNEDERRRLAAGDDIYISLLTFGGGPPGIIAVVGKEEAAAIYNVRPIDGGERARA